MKSQFYTLLTLLALIVLLAGTDSLAVPVDPSDISLHPSEGSTSRHYQQQQQQQQYQDHGLPPHSTQAAGPVSQQYDPFQAWLQQQPTTPDQYADDTFDYRRYLDPSTYGGPELHYELDPVAAQFPPPIQDSNHAASLWQEQQQQPSWSWHQSQGYFSPRPLLLGNEQRTNTFCNTPSSPSLIQPIVNYSVGDDHDRYFLNTEYLTEWQPEDDVSFDRSENAPGGGQESYLHSPSFGHDHTATPQNLYQYEQADHHSIKPKSEHHIAPSTSASLAEKSKLRKAYEEPTSPHSNQGSPEADTITEVIERWVPPLDHMLYKWEEYFPPSKRRRIIGTIVARWIEIRAPYGLPKQNWSQIGELRKAIRVESANAILAKDPKIINDLAIGSITYDKRHVNMTHSPEDQEARDRFIGLVASCEKASPIAIDHERILRLQEGKGSHRRKQYYKLSDQQKTKLNKSIQDHAAEFQMDSTARAQFLQYLKQNMTLDDMNILSFQQSLSFQAYYSAYERWQLSLQQQQQQQHG